jgi:CheY-specific phosphatase CheX
MTDLALSEALWVAVTEVLEKMFFIDTAEVEAEGGLSVSGEDGINARLTFEGVPPGCLWLRLTSGAARSLAADFLGEEASELSGQKIEEVIGELANMLCGSVLTRVESTTDFRLAAPEIVEAPVANAAQPAMASRTVALAGGILTVAMTMESTACTETEKYAS